MFDGIRSGRKNIYSGKGLFILLGILVGIPLTLNFLGIRVMSDGRYALWKVVHGYGIFLGLINYFFGLLIDSSALSPQEKEVASWSFLVAGVFGGLARSILVLFSGLEAYGLFASLGEVVFMTIGIQLFVSGQTRRRELAHLKESFLKVPVARQSVHSYADGWRNISPLKQISRPSRFALG